MLKFFEKIQTIIYNRKLQKKSLPELIKEYNELVDKLNELTGGTTKYKKY
jgi:flagellar capping protein FliD